MNWESVLMPAIVSGLALLGGYGAYMTLRADFKSETRENARRFSESEADRKDLRNRLEAIDKDTVKRDDFQRFDDRVGTRFDKIEHAVNNAGLKTAQIVKEALRDVLPQLRGRE